MRSRSATALAAIAVGLPLLVAWRWMTSLGCAIPDAAASGNRAWGADARLGIYVLTWVARALARQPGRLFDPPFGYPAPNALAGAENLLSSQVLFAPVFALTANPVLATNVTVIASYLLGGLVMIGLLRSWGLGAAAALAGGLANMLGPLQTPADVHMLQYPPWCLPLVVWAAERLERHGRPRDAASFAAAAALALFASYQIAGNAVVAIGVLCAVRAFSGPGGVNRAVVLGSLGAAVAGLLVIFSLPYAHHVGGLPGTMLMSDRALAAASSVARRATWDELRWSVIGLGLVGMVAGHRLGPGGRRAAMVGTGLALVGGMLACGWAVRVGGVAIPLPYALWAKLPMAQAISPMRFAILTGTGLAILCAVGVEAAGRVPLRTRVMRVVVPAVLVLAVAWETSAPFGDYPTVCLPVGDTIPPVYAWLRDRAHGPLLELPDTDTTGRATDARVMLMQADAMYFSLFHRLPILNVHTKFVPPGASLVADTVRRLPVTDGVQTLADMTDVRWILVRRSRLTPEAFAAWARLPELAVAFQDGDDVLFAVHAEPRFAWRDALARGPRPDATLLGTPLEMVERPEPRVSMMRVPESVEPAQALALLLSVRNEGHHAWPVALSPGTPASRAVHVEVRWDGPATIVASIPLPYDVEPGQQVAVAARIEAPPAPGRYDVRWGVAQGASFTEALRTPISVERPPR